MIIILMKIWTGCSTLLLKKSEIKEEISMEESGRNRRMETIKGHFEQEAQDFDDIIIKIIPYYEAMVEAIVTGLPFASSDPVDIIDLGCGTGTVALAIKKQFPHSTVTCLDLSDKMIELAKSKLKDYPDIHYITADFYEFEFFRKYDAVVSSLALHHLITNEDKQSFYRKIAGGLNSGGVFINADVVLGSNKNLQERYMMKWVDFMRRNCSMDEIQNKWLVNYRKEDSPANLETHFALMREEGFSEIDVLWKYYNFCVYIGRCIQKES